MKKGVLISETREQSSPWKSSNISFDPLRSRGTLPSLQNLLVTITFYRKDRGWRHLLSKSQSRTVIRYTLSAKFPPVSTQHIANKDDASPASLPVMRCRTSGISQISAVPTTSASLNSQPGTLLHPLLLNSNITLCNCWDSSYLFHGYYFPIKLRRNW